MDVILHLGTHRTATTSFQHYVKTNRTRLEKSGIGYWGPMRTRKKALIGVIPDHALQIPEEQFTAARNRVVENLDRARDRGITQLLVSDENVIGTPRKNLRNRQLYGGIGEKMARYSQVFDGRITRLVLSIRSHDTYWSSVAAYTVARGRRVPGKKALARLVRSPRQWRDVITDLACAVPGVEILIQPYEVFGGHQEWRLSTMTGKVDLPTLHARDWLNRAPGLGELREVLTTRGDDPAVMPEGDGRWHPFDRDQVMALREAYADDLFWLRAGADGLATLIEETAPVKAGEHLPSGDATRGQTDGKEYRRMA